MQPQIPVSDVAVGPLRLPGLLRTPDDAIGLVVFAHGSGSSRLSPRNTRVAADLGRKGLATLLFDLLTPAEAASRANVFDIGLLGTRVGHALSWAGQHPRTAQLPVGVFGASTGAAAALVAAAAHPDRVSAVVSRGGRPDLAGAALADVRAATLLIVGGADYAVLQLNTAALQQMTCGRELAIVPGATHLFEEPGALEQVVDLAAGWFLRHLRGGTP